MTARRTRPASPEPLALATAAHLVAPSAAAHARLIAMHHRDARRHRRTMGRGPLDRLRTAAQRAVVWLLSCLSLWLGLLACAIGYQAIARNVWVEEWGPFDRLAAASCGTGIQLRNVAVLALIAIGAYGYSRFWLPADSDRARICAAITATIVWAVARPTEGCGVAGFPRWGPMWTWHIAPILNLGAAFVIGGVAVALISWIWDLELAWLIT